MAPVTVVDFCYGWFLVVFQTWIPNYFVQNHGLNLGKTALFSTAVLFAGVIGDTVGGILTDTILHRTGSILLARRGVLILGFLGACLFMIPVVFTGDPIVATLCLSLAFFFAELIWAIAMDIAPSYAGTASGMMNFGFGLASILSPVFFGYTIEHTHNWTLAFCVSIALLLLGAFLTCFLRRTGRSGQRKAIRNWRGRLPPSAIPRRVAGAGCAAGAGECGGGSLEKVRACCETRRRAACSSSACSRTWQPFPCLWPRMPRGRIRCSCGNHRKAAAFC